MSLIRPFILGASSRLRYCQIYLKDITMTLMSSVPQSHIAPIPRFAASMLLFVFLTVLLTPCTSMAAPHEQGEDTRSQVQSHYHDIEVQIHCDDADSISESSQLALLSSRMERPFKPVFHLQPRDRIAPIAENRLVTASTQGMLYSRQWASLMPTSLNPSRYLASFRRQLI